MSDQSYSGWKTMEDGRRIPLMPAEAKALWEASEAASAKLAADMPTEVDALREMTRAFHRLKRLGWNDISYCPKDGSMFDAIEAGSTGIHRCNYQGEWPDGSWWIFDGDIWPSRPILYRLDPEAEKALKEKMDAALTEPEGR
jgi:hypothetical protein